MPQQQVAHLSALPMAQLVPLVTGGGSGIGVAIVDQFVHRGARKVLLTGRQEAVLQGTYVSYPAGMIECKVSDSGNVTDRMALFGWVQTNHPDCNALVNNAGIQRRVPLAEDMHLLLQLLSFCSFQRIRLLCRRCLCSIVPVTVVVGLANC